MVQKIIKTDHLKNKNASVTDLVKHDEFNDNAPHSLSLITSHNVRMVKYSGLPSILQEVICHTFTVIEYSFKISGLKNLKIK